MKKTTESIDRLFSTMIDGVGDLVSMISRIAKQHGVAIAVICFIVWVYRKYIRPWIYVLTISFVGFYIIDYFYAGVITLKVLLAVVSLLFILGSLI